ncbi:MAG: recombination protein RecR [Nevskiales bacterium]|uniref:Recombination protein RecR n=1 Tax=Abyssibacter profundi TaxID=2182787 RepID=A0A363UPZ2_9GAMM|nr:recombination protein RecR [Nevskiales bacterium]PWN57512.1 recombination protein RecR [Abyssibacter profundi]
MYPARLQALIDALRALPGVGRKSAQRMAFQLLEHDRQAARTLAQSLEAALESLRRCVDCRMFSDADRCPICRSQRRDRSVMCVVESPADLVAVEQGAEYSGLYFVLHGRLSPLDGVGPEEVGLPRLAERLAEDSLQEVIIATGSTVEGEATAHYVGELARAAGVSVTRIAQGVPMGGELEYVDAGTLSHAFRGRQTL